jgi:signal transduction histidine kinase
VATPVRLAPWFALSLVGVAAAALIAVAQRRLSHLQHARAGQEAFSRQLIATQESERKRIAGELHDGIGQQLLVIGNWAQLAMSPQSSSAEARAALEVIKDMAAQSMREIRALTHELQPYELECLRLPDALQAMLDRLTEVSDARFVSDLDQLQFDLPSDVRINLYRIAQEAATNVVKHARASEVRVTLRCRDSSIQLTISDNGCGFAAGPRNARIGFGLRSIAERTRLLGGTHEICSAPGRGTVITVHVPLRVSGGADGG